ncbi:MAG: hypothetical protein FWF27_00955 [Candidatus Bathyarchaeota archaeon]|nr:hypothetical protein [Candidatus Termiticorpusculum sp.]
MNLRVHLTDSPEHIDYITLTTISFTNNLPAGEIRNSTTTITDDRIFSDGIYVWVSVSASAAINNVALLSLEIYGFVSDCIECLECEECEENLSFDNKLILLLVGLLVLATIVIFVGVVKE